MKRDRQLIRKVDEMEAARRRERPENPSLHFFESVPFGATVLAAIGTGVIYLCPIHVPIRMRAQVLSLNMQDSVSPPGFSAAIYRSRLVLGAKGSDRRPSPSSSLRLDLSHRIGAISASAIDATGVSYHAAGQSDFAVDPETFPWLGVQASSADTLFAMSAYPLSQSGMWLQTQNIGFAGRPLPASYDDWPQTLSIDSSARLGALAFTLRSAIGLRFFGDGR